MLLLGSYRETNWLLKFILVAALDPLFPPQLVSLTILTHFSVLDYSALMFCPASILTSLFHTFFTPLAQWNTMARHQ